MFPKNHNPIIVILASLGLMRLSDVYPDCGLEPLGFGLLLLMCGYWMYKMFRSR